MTEKNSSPKGFCAYYLHFIIITVVMRADGDAHSCSIIDLVSEEVLYMWGFDEHQYSCDMNTCVVVHILDCCTEVVTDMYILRSRCWTLSRQHVVFCSNND